MLDRSLRFVPVLMLALLSWPTSEASAQQPHHASQFSWNGAQSGTSHAIPPQLNPYLWQSGLQQAPDWNSDYGFDIDWGYRRDLDSLGLLVTGLTVGGLGAVSAFGDDELIAEVGDYTQLALPTAGAIGALTEDSWEGAEQWGLHFGSAIITTRIGKVVLERWRPNAANTESFPSGHTTAAFTGAAFITERYGARFGVASYAAATYTGISRVIADAHFLGDVVAGAGVGMLWGWVWVTPYEPGKYDKPKVEPVMLDGGLGLRFPIRGEKYRPRDYLEELDEEPFVPTWRFEFGFGTAWSRNNIVQAPPDTGTPIDFSEFSELTNPDIYGYGSVQLFQGQEEFLLMIMPYEVRDFGNFSQPVSFGGETFAAGVDTRTGFLYHDYRFGYRHNFETESALTLKLGLDLALQHTEVSLDNGTQSARVSSIDVMPMAHGHIGVRLGDWWLFGEIDGMVIDEISQLETHVILQWAFSKQWDLNLGYHYLSRTLENSEMYVDTVYDSITLAVGHSF